MTAQFPFPFPLSQPDIMRGRARILTALCLQDDGFARMPASALAPETLQSMLRLYDAGFFGGLLGRTYGELTVTLSSRLTSSAGKFIYSRSPARRLRSAEIRMSSDFLYRLDRGPFQLNGLSVATPQEAFLIVFEHELCHAAETALFGGTSHSARFLALANGLFGHTATRHSLPTRQVEAAQNGLTVGSIVSFESQGKTFRGLLTYIGKTATVMVRDSHGPYRDRAGRRYVKYRVAIPRLKKDS